MTFKQSTKNRNFEARINPRQASKDNDDLDFKRGSNKGNPIFFYFSQASLSGKYIIAVVDSGNQVAEINENNNWAVTSIP